MSSFSPLSSTGSPSPRKCGYEVLLELPLLSKLRKKRGVDDEGEGASSEDSDGDANTDDERDGEGFAVVNKAEVQRVFLAKLFLCSLSVEKLSSHPPKTELEELQTVIPFQYPGFTVEQDHGSINNLVAKKQQLSSAVRAPSPSTKPSLSEEIEYSANSPARRRYGDDAKEAAVVKARLENELRQLKRKNSEQFLDIEGQGSASPSPATKAASSTSVQGGKRSWLDDETTLAAPSKRRDEHSPVGLSMNLSPPQLERKGSRSSSAESSPSPSPSQLERKSSVNRLMDDAVALRWQSASPRGDRPSSPALEASPKLLRKASRSKLAGESSKFGTEDINRDSPRPASKDLDDAPASSVKRGSFDLNERDEDTSPFTLSRKKSSSTIGVSDKLSSVGRTECIPNKGKIGSKKSSLLQRHSAEYLAREVKRESLMELITFVRADGLDWVTDKDICLRACVEMVRKNLFRRFPSPPRGKDSSLLDPDDDTPVLDPRWPHLSVVYELMLRLLSTRALTKAHLDGEFCSKLIDLFRTEDPRERDYLKNMLHRIYGTFPQLRPVIRKEVQSTFEVFVNERQRHVGILELLEVVGSIVSGFSVPLKRDNMEFFTTALLPLHRADSIVLFHNQLTYCVSQIVQKHDPAIVDAIQTIKKYFPWNCASKQLLFLNELDELMEIFLHGEAGKTVGRRLATSPRPSTKTATLSAADAIDTTISSGVLAELLSTVAHIVEECLNSEHFQVVERALFLWNSDLLAHRFFKSSMPHMTGIFLAIEKDRSHWNPTVRSLAEEVAHLYRGDEYYEDATSEPTDANERRKQRELTERQRLWDTILARAESK